MTLRTRLIIYGVIACLLLLCFIGIKIAMKKAYSRAEQAEARSTELQKTLEDTERRLAESQAAVDGLQDALRRAYLATERAAAAIQTAQEAYYEREKTVDSLPSDWMQCELPAGVQDMFGAYCDAD